MKFTKLPLNGASWADELLYTFDTEFAEPIDVIVDIINSDTREIVGQQRLRGVTTGSINIAPYIRSKMQALQVAPSLDRPISTSPSSIVISLRCNGTWSDSRLFFRATYDPLHPAIISQYTALRDDYVAPTVAAWTRYMVQPLLGHRCEACLANSQSDIYASTTAGNNRLDSIMQTLRSKARTLSRRLSDHLNAHSDEYPEYNPNANPLNRCSIDGDIIQIR